MTLETTGPLEKKKLSHIHVFLLVGKFIKLFLWRIFNLQRFCLYILCNHEKYFAQGSGKVVLTGKYWCVFGLL